jgi:isopentenyldiphosphate isomerase
MPHGRHIAVITDPETPELVEVVDRDGVVLDVVVRSDMRRKRLRHRAVFIAVINDDGELLVHRRAEHKDVWPMWWDIAVGGVVGCGESFEQAALRELGEELGIYGVTVSVLGSGAYEDDTVALVAQCYVVTHNGPFQFTDNEITQAHWISPAELDHWLKSKQFLPDSLALVLPRLPTFARIVT